MPDSEQPAGAVSWYYLEHFGFSKAPPQTDAEVVRNMARALVSVASADGTLSEDEKAWILGYFAAKGYPTAVVEEMATATPVGMLELPGLMDLGILRQSARILVYDAIRASSADGYSAGERAAVRQAASLLGIDEGGVAELERLAADEEAMKARRIALLMPEGHPNLAPRFRR